MYKILFFLIGILIVLTGCRKDDGFVQPKLSPDTGLDILWDNKPDDYSGDLRLLIYTSDADYNTPFAKPLIDTMFSYSADRSWRVTFRKFTPGTYWIKMFSVNEPEIYINSNRNVSAKFDVIKDKMNPVDIHSIIDSPKTFMIHKITINKVDSFLHDGDSWNFEADQVGDQNYGEDPAIFKAKIKTSQLPYTIDNLNINIKSMSDRVSAPVYYLAMWGASSGEQNRVNFPESLQRARIFNDKIYVWNSNNELAYVLEGEWNK